MAAAIDFYFDFSSPYGYFAAQKIEALAARHGRTVNWHPILLGVVFKATGAAPLPLVPLKGEYAYRDFERSARFHGIEYRRPSRFPMATQAAARAMLWIADQHGAARAVEFAKSVYRAYFVDDANISEPAVLAEIAGRLGFDGAALAEAINSPAVKERLKAEVDEAMARKVFGSPFMIVDGEPFWGFDRFEQLEAFLRDGRI
jgi:2-hydroxychromene-2-carboxylate isomerase